MNEEERAILYKQLELLSSRSQNCDDKHLAEITTAMVALYSVLIASM